MSRFIKAPLYYARSIEDELLQETADMRKLATLVVVAVVAASCAQTVNVEQEKTALFAADAEWLKNAKDIDRFTSFFTPDAHHGHGRHAQPVKGPQAVKDRLGPMMKAPGFASAWKAIWPTCPRPAISVSLSATYALTMNNPAGAPSTEKGNYLTTWKKVDGAWKVIYDTGSPDGPPPLLSSPVATPAAAVKWMDAPPFLPKGAKLAVLVGDPSKPEPFTFRLQMPDGYRLRRTRTRPTNT